MMRRLAAGGLLSLIVLLAACQGQSSLSDRGADGLRVVATTTVIADLARNVGGTGVTVVSLLPAGADPHTFEPSPQDSKTLARAQVLLVNGQGLEEWLEPLIAGSGTKVKPVVVSEGLQVRRGSHDQHHRTAGAVPAQNESENDPHFWFDVKNVMHYVNGIRDALAQADPANSATYRQNAEQYLRQLAELDRYIVEQVETVPQARRKLVTSHDTLGYFADRYGFEIIGTIIPGVSAEAQPSAQQIGQLLQVIREEQVPAIFAESTVNPRLAEQLARDAGVRVITDLYTDSLNEPGKPADTYLKMMRHNVDQIVAGLK
jgi:zinc/manganese transport system substrate-binding protein